MKEAHHLSREAAGHVARAFGVEAFGELRALTFLGKRPDGVPVQWRLREATGELDGVVVGAGLHVCAVWRVKEKWECTRSERFGAIMASGLMALGIEDEEISATLRSK